MAAGSPQTLQRRAEDGSARPDSWGCALRGELAEPLAGELPSPAGSVWAIPFTGEDLKELRELVAAWAGREALTFDDIQDLVLAVHEIATNSVRHGGGEGLLKMWRDGESLVCDIQDHGHIANPQIGRLRPDAAPDSSRGMWIANQLCDLVQVSCSPRGNRVRLYKQIS